MAWPNKCDPRPDPGLGNSSIPDGIPHFQVQGLAKNFDDRKRGRPVFDDVTLAVDQGELVALIGPSGCGKSTFFNLLAGLTAPTAGAIYLHGRRTPHLRGRVAYMQQKDLLLPWRNSLDNAILGLEIMGASKPEARREARKLFAAFGLEGFEKHRPRELSGGMRQRVALMRTILCRKDILLLDEPFGALDAITRRTIQKWFLTVWAEFRPTVVLVTHDVDEALIMADKVHVLTGRPASVKETVTVPFERPRKPTTPGMVELREHLLTTLEAGAVNGAL